MATDRPFSFSCRGCLWIPLASVHQRCFSSLVLLTTNQNTKLGLELFTYTLLWNTILIYLYIYIYIPFTLSGNLVLLSGLAGLVSYSTLFTMKSSILLQALSLVNIGYAAYNLVDDYSGDAMFSMFNAYTGADPTQGFGKFHTNVDPCRGLN